MAKNKIIIKGAREHNLKNVSLEIPRDKLVCFTGLSGSGKSSLAFDTIYADGQRRYIESLSSYARQFIGRMEKPNVDSIEGLSPAISIDQKTTSRNPRSTVGTVTEINDYLRLLYANIGVPHCPICNREIKRQSVDQMVDRILALPEKAKIQVLAPIVRNRKGQYKKELENARKSGYVRVRVDGIIYDTSEEIALDKNKKHTIEIVIDRLIVSDSIKSRLADSCETAIGLTGGILGVNARYDDKEEDLIFSENYACPEHNISLPELSPNMFSFNNPNGACPVCTGLGTFLKASPDLIVPNKNLSIRESAIKASGWYFSEGGIAEMYFVALSEKYGFSLDTPFKDLPKEAKDIIFYGTKGEKLKMYRDGKSAKLAYETDFEGVCNNLERRFRETNSNWMREEIVGLMSSEKCHECGGSRLKKEVLAVTVGGLNISEVCELSILDCLEFFDKLSLSEKDAIIAEQILKEIRERLGFLKSVGLGYLTLSRASSTLSGGESQRIRLATQIGSSLMGVLYILDEPSIGLHQKDNDKLIATLKHLRDLGNTVIVVEHDEDTMRASDFIVDVGPMAGANGGEIVCAGTPEKIMKCKKSYTGKFLSGEMKIDVPEVRRRGNGKFIEIKGAEENNLKNIDVKIPLGELVAVTGVSGSGKSSLVNEVLYKNLANLMNGTKKKAGKCREILGAENIDKIIEIDQSPIGRTPRSNPATYTGVFSDIRELFANTPDAKARGYNPGRFSFNVKGGRCEACEGDGILQIEMHFLPDVYVPCEVCNGKRYNRETLEIKYKGKSIYDVLEMTVEEGLVFFENHPKIRRKLQTLYDVGLGYIKIGQNSATLSGGEAQRVKLATELSKRGTGNTLYILDEPTTGLHSYDVKKLIRVLQSLVDKGNTAVFIEHNLDMIKTADYVIDLGRDGGDAGGEILEVGTPEEIASSKISYTGEYLKRVLNKD